MRVIILSRNGGLYSTRSLYNAARRRNHFVRVVDHLNCDLYIDNNQNSIFVHGQQISGYDVVIPRIGHSVTPHGASVIRQFESMNVATVLSSDSLLRTTDKLSCIQILSKAGIPVPKTIMINNYNQISFLHKKISSFPKILKFKSGTHGLGVLKADNEITLESMMEAFHDLKQKVLIQDFIEESAGQDVRIFVVDGEVVGSMIRQAQDGEFRSNLHRGGNALVAQISDEEKRVALKAVKVLNINVAGVDLLRSKDGPLVLEVNASPGLEGIETITKVDIAKKIIQFAERIVKNKG